MITLQSSVTPRRQTNARNRKLEQSLIDAWSGDSQHLESTLHQLSPYVGKLKSTMAAEIIRRYTIEGDTVYDPFCGSGSVALESWAAKRRVIATDLSPYAVTLTLGKLFPARDLNEANVELEKSSAQVARVIRSIDLRNCPKWVRGFYHPETLKELVAWATVLKKRKSHFLLSCLLGISHHQRPGFLSYPSSHAVPYLRDRKFPREFYPDLYEYRGVYERLVKKVQRSMKRVEILDNSVERSCHLRSAATFIPKTKVNAVITSPPYMRRLDYGRDNRLRLWFLGTHDWAKLDRIISPRETQFLNLFRRSLKHWWKLLTPAGRCILVVGDSYCRTYNKSLPETIAKIASDEIGGYSLEWKFINRIPDARRVRRGYNGNKDETLLVLRRHP
ncbi:MAG TPA: DNA methyltransferase [Pyrinomonadaceae bacterium]|nr:DNA methyltransferase [Pyrinomonadaceae bacterium]